MELTETQKEYLKTNLTEFYKLFVIGDPDLLKTTCSCCQEKRKFVEALLKQ